MMHRDLLPILWERGADAKADCLIEQAHGSDFRQTAIRGLKAHFNEGEHFYYRKSNLQTAKKYQGESMVDGINDHTRFIVDLRRHMWMDGIEVELRRLIWQIAVVGKYISAKIHESNRKLAGFKNVYGEDQLALDRISDDILKNMLRNSGFVREYASEEQKDIVTIGQGKSSISSPPIR